MPIKKLIETSQNEKMLNLLQTMIFYYIYQTITMMNHNYKAHTTYDVTFVWQLNITVVSQLLALVHKIRKP